MLRLFVALDLPRDARKALMDVGKNADKDTWRVLGPETLHVTLAFLGPRPESDVAMITPTIAAEAGTPAPSLELGKVLLLPPRRARVLTVELKEHGLREVQARLSARLADAGVYTPEKRAFRPHVTVARLRPRVRPPREVDAEVERLRFYGTAVTLYVSRLHPHGARYEALATAAFATP